MSYRIQPAEVGTESVLVLIVDADALLVPETGGLGCNPIAEVLKQLHGNFPNHIVICMFSKLQYDCVSLADLKQLIDIATKFDAESDFSWYVKKPGERHSTASLNLRDEGSSHLDFEFCGAPWGEEPETFLRYVVGVTSYRGTYTTDFDMILAGGTKQEAPEVCVDVVGVVSVIGQPSVNFYRVDQITP